MPHGWARRSDAMKTLHEWLDRLSPGPLIGVSICGVAVVGALDYASGPDLSFSIFYVLPVSCAAWFHSRRAGTGLAILSAIVWYVADAGWARHSSPLLPLWNSGVRLGFFVLISALFAELRSRLEAEERMADTDPLTGALNRRCFFERAQAEIERSARFGGPFTVVYLDLDDFKSVNDAGGHAAGDALLREVAGILRSASRSQDLVGRLGGDEFVLLLVETPANAASPVVERLRRQLEGVGPGRVTASLGAVSYETPPSDVQQMVSRADALMFEAKRGGKNAVVLAREAPGQAP